MKKWLAMLLAALTLLTGSALAEAASDVEPQMSVTFEMFCAEVGVPYSGEWVCFDDAVYLYLPSALARMEITEDLRAEGVLAAYIGAIDQEVTAQFMIGMGGYVDSVQTVIEEFKTFCPEVYYFEINGLPVVCGIGVSDNALYAQVLTAAGTSYRIQMDCSDETDDAISVWSMYAYGMLYSISETEREVVGEPAYVGEREKTIKTLSSEIRIQFDFHDREPENLDTINAMLAAMQLTDVKAENLEEYLGVWQKLDQGEVVETTYIYGLKSGTLICEMADSGQKYRYQIAIEAFDSAEAMGEKEFLQYWKATYPGRRLDMVSICEYEHRTLFIVVYYEPISE